MKTMSDPIEWAINRGTISCYLNGVLTCTVILEFDLSWVGALIAAGLSGVAVAIVGSRARREIYGHLHDATRMRRGWV